MCLPGDGTVPPGSPAAANLHRGLSGIGRSGSLLHEPSSPGEWQGSGVCCDQGRQQPVRMPASAAGFLLAAVREG